jgi:hypothetical protein
MSRWKRIVVHHSAGSDGENADFFAIRNYHVHQRGYLDIGYHFIVEYIKGSPVVICGRALNVQGAHARGANGDSIGICFVGDYTKAPPPMDMLVEGASIIAGLISAMDLLGRSWVEKEGQYRAFLLEEIVLPHRLAGTTPTQCPGSAFPFDILLSLVREYLDLPSGG